MATKNTNAGSFRDFVLKKEEYKGKWGKPVPAEDQADWTRAADHWEWPEIPERASGPAEAEYVARDDNPKDGLGSLQSPGQDKSLGLLKKMPGKGRMAGPAKKSSRLREHARGLSDAEYIDFMMEQLDAARQARPITLVSDLNGNQFTPSPEETFRYVATLAQNPLMLSRLVGSLKETGLLADLVRELADDRDAVNGLVGVLGDPDSGPQVAGRLAKAMYDQMVSRQDPGAQVDLGSVAEAVSGPVWQETPPGLDNFGGEAGQDGTGEQTEDTDDQNPNLPPAPADPAVPGQGDDELSLGPAGPEDEPAIDPADLGGDAGGVEGDVPEDPAGMEGEADDDMDSQVGSFAQPPAGPQASSAASHLVQAMMRYKPLADLAKGV